MILAILFTLIMLAVIAEIGKDGLWHSLLTFFNVLFAGTLTMNFFEPVALQLDIWMPSFSYFVDFLAFWAIFTGFSLAIRLLTLRLSRVRVRFIKLVDLTGGFFFGLWTGWILISLVATSLHLAPLAVNSFGGNFQSTPESRMLWFAPDRHWLALMQKTSQGSFARPVNPETPSSHVFDPKGTFILTYGARRGTLETLPALRVQRTWGSGIIQEPTLTAGK
ncbi:MAG: CvpA family protein [Planctomycetota bacterium]|nr:CvpA family protein [Planctomycetota bacterium]